MRPLIVAEPMLRAGSPETVALVICGAFCPNMVPMQSDTNATQFRKFIAARRASCGLIVISFLMSIVKKGFCDNWQLITDRLVLQAWWYREHALGQRYIHFHVVDSDGKRLGWVAFGPDRH